MPNILVGYAQVNTYFDGPGAADDDTVVTFGIKPNPEDGVLVLADLLARWASVWNAFYNASLCTGWSVKKYQMRYRNALEPAPLLDFEIPSTVTGRLNAPPVPPNCAVLVRKTTGVSGRRNKGRFFLPGCLDKDNVDSAGMLSGPYLVAMQTRLVDTFNALTDPNPPGAGLLPVVLHSEGIPGVPAEVLGFSLQPKIATQRRRLR